MMDPMKNIADLITESRALLRAPGLPPRPGLVWDSRRHRWIRPKKRTDVQEDDLFEIEGRS